MSDTPRTDAQVKGDPCNGYPILTGNLLRDAFIPSDFARQLERENAALLADKERLDWMDSEESNRAKLFWTHNIRAAIDAARKETK